jgi:hypothetical protein
MPKRKTVYFGRRSPVRGFFKSGGKPGYKGNIGSGRAGLTAGHVKKYRRK